MTSPTELLQAFLLVLLFLIALYIFFVQVVLRIISRYYHFPVPAFITRIIDNPIRRRFIQNPDRIARRMKLKSGMVVLEIGPGKGNYTKAVAGEILPSGVVHAIDVQQAVISRLITKAEKEKIDNIVPRIDNVHSLSFDDNTFDRVFAITCLPEIPEPVNALRELNRVLKPGGILSLCEFFLDPDYPLRRTAKNWAREANLELCGEYGNWFAYQLNFVKGKDKNEV